MERLGDDLLSRRAFYHRLFRYGVVATALAGLTLAVGMAGYCYFEGLSWPEAFVNAAMLLAAMGPLTQPKTDAGMIFAGLYAIFCGLVFLFIAGLLVTPIAHRLLHLFHADPDES